MLGQGKFIDNIPEGLWVIFDTKGKKVAELNYEKGCIDGPYRLWYGHKQEATHIKTFGHGKNCKLEGDFERYLPNGDLLVRYKASAGVVTSVNAGSWANAEEQLQADAQLLQMYLNFITGKSS